MKAASLRNRVRPQRTLARSTSVSGIGYWSGRAITVEFHPAPAYAGVFFVRTDLVPHKYIPAKVAHRADFPRRTNLQVEGASVEMVEHVLAALAGLNIDNCEIRVNSAEMPGCDGSSGPFTEALVKAGTVGQAVPAEQIIISEPVRVGNDKCWVEAAPHDAAGLTIQCTIDYGSQSAIGLQTVRLEVTPETFRQELAFSRTFILLEEIEMLRQHSQASKASFKDLLVYGPHGPVENTLRYENECVRHKALDLIGDLSLAGCLIQGRVIAWCSGHKLNAELVQALLAQAARKDRRRSA